MGAAGSKVTASPREVRYDVARNRGAAEFQRTESWQETIAAAARK
jgi:hypothetical protein